VQPLLVVFEDIHWVDAETQARWSHREPAGRPAAAPRELPAGVSASLGRSHLLHPAPAGPLAPESAEELLAALLGPDAGLDPLKRVLIARTQEPRFGEGPYALSSRKNGLPS
jgi:hypothetical protein